MPTITATYTIGLASDPIPGQDTLVFSPSTITLRAGDRMSVAVQIRRADGSVVSPPPGAVLVPYWGSDNHGVQAGTVGNGQIDLLAPPSIPASAIIALTVEMRNA